MNFHELRPIVHARSRGMNMQRSKAFAEGDMLVRGDVLVAKKNHQMLKESAVQCRKSIVVDGERADQRREFPRRYDELTV